MEMIWIILSIVIFFIGFLTPISGLFTLPISVALMIWGIFVLFKTKRITR
ncbi:MAG: hypothetical protein M3Z62_09530 [Metasolibacillus sp.]|nr:hypothetical protein [Metasolibacillus sp.]